jgi:S-adenosylmethionine synthetase
VKTDFIFTSESITSGHPDKLCDQVSDAIVDHFLKQDPYSNIVAECAVASGVMFIAARYASMAKLDIPEVARNVVRGVGYPKQVFDADACTIMTSFLDQTATDYQRLDLEDMDDEEISRITAKNQVTVFGYACDQTPNLMPLPIWLAHRLALRLDSADLRETLSYVLPDGQTQVGIEFGQDKSSRVHSITLIASQAEVPATEATQMRDDLIEQVVIPVLKEAKIKLDDNAQIFVNPNGPVIGGGPTVHSGMTGRKTGVDSYGEYARHSGAALSGKGPMRIDRIGAYAARYAAKNIVAAKLAPECEVQLSYTVGVAEPVSVRVRTFGSGKVDDQAIAARVDNVFDFRVGAIVRDLELRRLPAKSSGGFEQLAVYGQMGREDLKVPWEKRDKAEELAG